MTSPPGEPEEWVETDRAVPAVLPPTLVALNMNLCNSGSAPCYTGEAIAKAQAVMWSVLPDVVTLQEICLSEIIISPESPGMWGPLFSTMTQIWPGSAVFAAFMPVLVPGTSQPVACTGGRGEFGNAVFGRVQAADWNGLDVVGGYYAVQDGNLRNFVCADAVGNYHTCATHLTAGEKDNAMAQCHELMTEVVSASWDDRGYQPTVVGGDFNRQEVDWPWNPWIGSCVPFGWWRSGVGVTHVMATNDFSFRVNRRISWTAPPTIRPGSSRCTPHDPPTGNSHHWFISIDLPADGRPDTQPFPEGASRVLSLLLNRSGPSATADR